MHAPPATLVRKLRNTDMYVSTSEPNLIGHSKTTEASPAVNLPNDQGYEQSHLLLGTPVPSRGGNITFAVRSRFGAPYGSIATLRSCTSS